MPDPLRDPVRGYSEPTEAVQRLPDDMNDQELAQLAFRRLFGSEAMSELSDEEAAARMEGVPDEPAPELTGEQAAARMTPLPTGQAGQRAQTRVGTIPAVAVGSAIKEVPQPVEQPIRAEQPQADPFQMDRERVFNFMQRSQAVGMPIVPEYDISQVRTEVERRPEAFTEYSEEIMNIDEQIEALLYRKAVLEEGLGAAATVGE